MNDTVVLTEIVISCAMLAFLGLYVVAAHRRENFRADIRRIRDGLFDAMWKNGFSYEDPAYIETRQVMNGMLRASNSMNALKFIGFIYLFEIHGRRTPLATSACSELQQILDRAREKAIDRFMRFIFTEGVTGVLVYALVMVMRWRNSMQAVSKKLVCEFLIIGSPAYGTVGRHCHTY